MSETNEKQEPVAVGSGSNDMLGAASKRTFRVGDGALIVGHFYWVSPVFDCDTNDEWENESQPARYAGMDERGCHLWNYLGIEGASKWPTSFIGREIDAQRKA
jgi:hypothetical protein